MRDPNPNSISKLAFATSVLALLISGFALYQTLALRQTSATSNAVVPNNTAPQQPQPTPTTAPQIASPSPSESISSPTAATAGIQPKQFVQPAFGSIGEVELLSVKRIQDPATGKQDVVNVQFRLRRLSDKSPPALNQIFNPAETAARNPDTSETYEAVDPLKRTTSPFSINLLAVNASVDGYVWMKIPEGVNTVDLLMKETQGFKNVPIAN
ncbi:MAG: hypothetical protein KME27_16005 [Lyngbya sp. HA4199-MV5]|jgi:hypothetical protein|nr:hypothetical protein [Lyngbya sp. HA4199-MV5]